MAAKAIFITAVGSDSRPGKQHKIFWLPEQGRFVCGCEAFRYNPDRDDDGCKHLRGLLGVVTKVNSCLAQQRAAQRPELEMAVA